MLGAVERAQRLAGVGGFPESLGADPDDVTYPVGGEMDLLNGEVSSNTVCGVNVQTEDFDLSQLQDGVRYVDNGINLDSSQMPVPESIEGLDP